MTTVIRSNGSKWAGSAQDDIPTLLAVLGREQLDPRFEVKGQPGAFAERREGGTWRFFGNFACVSHVFNVESNDPETVRALRLAIIHNRRGGWYRSARQGMRAAGTL
ncbi:MAG: hypothetical protein NTV85_28525 [Hyphomicrobiales bacterium]|nr:hypothetical protein [Hyphomicrobiales bacterium]